MWVLVVSGFAGTGLDSGGVEADPPDQNFWPPLGGSSSSSGGGGVKPPQPPPPPPTNRTLVRRKRFALSFFSVTAGAYTVDYYGNLLSIANVNRFVSVNQMKIMSFGNCFEQLSPA